MKRKIPPRNPFTVFLYESRLLELAIALLDIFNKIILAHVDFVKASWMRRKK